MKKHLLILIISTQWFSCSGQINQSYKTESERVLDSIISIAKTQSIYKDNIDWSILEKNTFERLQNTDSISSIIEPVQFLLTELGDFHGFFTVIDKQYKAKGKKKRNVSYDYLSQKYQDKMMAIYQKSKQSTEINGKILKDLIAYIEIPMIENYQGNQELNIEYTFKIRRKICELEKYSPKGYIIDLRSNLGGTALPMLSGLGELFNNAEIGGATKDGKSFSSKWSIKEGNAIMGKDSIPNLPKTNCNCDITKTNKKVAVLVGRYTSSSGELVASSLKSQKNVKLFGEQTMGWSTINGWFLVASNVAFNPAVSYYMSIDKTTHIDGVIPDISIAENFDYENPTNGNVIEKVIKWINE
ncbi:hypothetical protein A9Q86_10065 [Flavobacteriales bacterium 33_180_T64]|nr:hypothetical protein A9Q86_10065 [Flavobacteriales bacterium 33_180_T64]